MVPELLMNLYIEDDELGASPIRVGRAQLAIVGQQAKRDHNRYAFSLAFSETPLQAGKNRVITPVQENRRSARKR